MSLAVPITVALIAAVGMVLLSNWMLARAVPSDRSRNGIGLLLQTMASLYGLLTGFILSVVWGNVETVRSAALTEVNALIDLKRIAASAQPPTGAALSSRVEAYLGFVVNDELRAMAEGKTSQKTTEAFDRLYSVVAEARPETMPGGDLGRALDKVDAVGEQRRIRILLSSESTPEILWAILLLGAVVIVYGSTIVVYREGRPAVGILIGAAITLSLALAAIYVMEEPYRHGTSPGSDRYERLWREFQSAAERGSPSPPPGSDSTHP